MQSEKARQMCSEPVTCYDQESFAGRSGMLQWWHMVLLDASLAESGEKPHAWSFWIIPHMRVMRCAGQCMATFERPRPLSCYRSKGIGQSICLRI